MPTVIVNDVEVEAQEGETLLDIARRSAAHVGFACGGLGICMSCVCRVRKGLEHISPPNRVERRGLPKPWLERGHRVACQARLIGPGPVDILSRPEELWRLTKAAFSPSEGEKLAKNWINLGKFVGDMSLQQWLIFPMNSINAWFQAMQARPSPKLVIDVVKDTTRVIKHMTSSDSKDGKNLEEQKALQPKPDASLSDQQTGEQLGILKQPHEEEIQVRTRTVKRKR